MGRMMKDTTLLSMQTKREEAGSILAGAEGNRLETIANMF